MLARRAQGLDDDARARLAGGLVISTYSAHIRLPRDGDGFAPPVVGGPMQSPGQFDGFGVAPDHLAALLFGGRGLAGLRRIRPDVYGSAQVGDALFPPLSADVLSYYLPW